MTATVCSVTRQEVAKLYGITITSSHPLEGRRRLRGRKAGPKQKQLVRLYRAAESNVYALAGVEVG